jgi:hypothetical protein
MIQGSCSTGITLYFSQGPLREVEKLHYKNIHARSPVNWLVEGLKLPYTKEAKAPGREGIYIHLPPSTFSPKSAHSTGEKHRLPDNASRRSKLLEG